MEPPSFPIVFWCKAPEAGLIGAVSLFKFRRIKHLAVAAITFTVMWNAKKLTPKVPPMLVGIGLGCILYYALDLMSAV